MKTALTYCLLLLLFLVESSELFAQKEASVWVIQSGVKVDFNFDPPQASPCYIIGGDGASSIADKNGNLLFYATVAGAFTKNCSFMPYGQIYSSGNGFDNQPTLILPNPGNDDLFYLFQQYYNGFFYFMVDMTVDNGLGDIVSGFNLIDSFTDGSLTAVRHSDGRSIWLITHGKNDNVFKSFLITNKGIDNPVLSSAGSTMAYAYIKASPDGKYIAQITSQPAQRSQIINLFKFNNTTGKVEELLTIMNGDNIECLAFSSNGSKLYVSASGNPPNSLQKIYQYNLVIKDSAAIKNNEKIIYTTQSSQAEDMQLATNGNIYLTFRSLSPYSLAEISNANDVNCTFNYNGIILPTYSYFTLPFFLQSYFFAPDFEAKGSCLGDVTSFYLNDTIGVDSVHWDFGDTLAGMMNYSNHWRPNHQYNDTGLYLISAFVYHKGKADTTQREIRISLYPNASFSILSDTIQCVNADSFHFISHSSSLVGNYTLYWDFGDDSVAFNDTVSHSFLKPNTYNVKLTALSDYGCAHSDSNYVEVYAPSTDFYINDSTQCLLNNGFVFSADTLKQDQKTTYFWDIAGQDTGSQVMMNKSFATYGDYTVTHVAKYEDGCVDTASKQLHVFPMPQSGFSINDSNQCLNWNKFVFTNLSSIDTGNLTFLWQFHDSAGSNKRNPVFKYTNEGNFTVGLIASSEKQCSDTFTKQVLVHPSAIAGYSINNPVQCLNENHFEFTDQSKLSNGILSWLWTFGDGDSSVLQYPFKDYGAFKKYTVTLVASTEYGCADTVSKLLEVVSSPTALFAVNNPKQCQKNNFFIFINRSSVPQGSLTYQWDLGDGFTSNSNSLNHVYLNGDTFEVKLIATSNNSCIDTFRDYVIVGPMPQADFTINNPAQCFNEQQFVISDQSSVISDSIVRLKWILNGDQLSNLPTFQLSNLQPTTYTIKLTTITTQGCTDSINKAITVHPSPIANFSINDSTQCLDSNSFDFTNLSVISDGVLSNQWIVDTTNFLTFQPSNFSTKQWGKFPVTLISTSDHNCPDTATANIYVYPMPVAAFIYLNNCLEDTMWFYDSSLVDSGKITQWYWDFKNGNSSANQNPFTIYYDTGQKSVTLISTSDFGCASDTTQFFKIESKVSPPILERATVEDDESILVEWKKPDEGIPMTYHIERSDDGNWWDWIQDEDYSTYSFEDYLVRVDDQSYFYRIKSTDSCDYTGDYSDYGKTILLKVDTNGVYPKLSWTPYELWVDGVMGYELLVAGSSSLVTRDLVYQRVTSNEQRVTKFTDSLTKLNAPYYCYRVIAYRNGDSLQSVSNVVCIPAEFRLYVPNSFTPNGDGLNDIFQPKGIFITNYNLLIFDRWGEKLFESNDISNGWDGTFKGESCPLGVYFYQLSARGPNGGKKVESGSITLLR
ncbi:PKD domain-containing protein [Bacteroidota bacterium]